MLISLKSYLEKITVTPISWLLGVSGILMVRFFLESLSSSTSSGFFASDASTLIHYYLFFLAIAVIIMIFLQSIVPRWKNVIPQLTALSLLTVFIAPIADWIITGGKGVKMAYLFDTSKELFASFFSFFSANISANITEGIRIEVAFILLFAGLLMYGIEKNFQKAIVSLVFLYIIIFFFLSLPSFVSMIAHYGYIAQNPITFFQNSIANSSTVSNNIHSTLQYSSATRSFEISFNFIMGKILFLILLLSSSFWFYINCKEKYKAILKNSRIERVVHYLCMVLLGFFAAYVLFPAVTLNWNDWLSLIILCFSFYFSWIFAVCVNDIADEDIDAISNTGRPLIVRSLSKEDMKQAAALFLVASLISAYLAGYTAFFFLLAFTALYYIYSAPPTRFKIIPFFSSFLIGLCCLTAVLAGFFMLSPVKSVSSFPSQFAVAVVVIFFFGSHVRDMKDIEGDKAAGITTVPVLLGDVLGPKIVGIFSGLAFLLVPIFTGLYILFIPAIFAAMASYYFINKKPYKEKLIFGTYFAFLLAGFLLLLI